MKKEVKEKRFSLKWIVVFVVVAVLIFGSWWLFFSYDECRNWTCFNEHLVDCEKAKFIGERDMIFEYVIRGGVDSICRVDMQLLQGELNNQDSIKLEMQKMTCMLPMGVLMIPESDIGNCHGTLKEGLQDLIIKKLHTYLVQNVGQINLEVLDVPEVS